MIMKKKLNKWFSGRPRRLAEKHNLAGDAHRVRDADLAPLGALGDFWNYSFLTKANRWHSELLKTKLNNAAVAIYRH